MMNPILLTKIKGFAAANIAAVLIILINKAFNLRASEFIFSEFVIIPFLMGIISAWFWRDLNLNWGRITGFACLNGLIAIIVSFLFYGEGVICLVIASPLLFSFIIAGTFAGRAMFKRNNQKLNVSVIAMLAVIFIADSVSTHNYENMVTDTMLINAPASRVWKNVVAFKKIKEQNKFWLFRIGMPSPVESTVEGYYLGAKRKCIFSNGYIFDEKIVAFDIDKNLTFDVTNQPRDPEIMGHIDILRGQFLLQDNGNGTTTLVGNSWYRLYVFPVWYYDTWAKSITRNVHVRVMEHIKELSEAK
ncbi:hypothetical protein BH09BAC6_BH09BAC6_19360 [soil metagenome]|jgi:hypothetical protein